jgi:multidrug resistance efflux pump
MRGKIIVRVLLVIVVVALAAAGGYFWWTAQAAAKPTRLTASGIIEATEITVSAESTGRVKAVLAAEGDAVTAGQILVQLDDTLLQSQRRQAEASLAAARGSQAAAEADVTAAQSQLDGLRAGARSQEIAAEQQAVAAAQAGVAVAGGQLQQARGTLQAATAARELAVARFAQVKEGARPAEIDAASVAYQQAAAAVQVAQADYDRIKGEPDVGASPQALALEQATLTLEAAKSHYQGVLAGATTPELNQARAGIDQAVAGIIQASATVSQTEAALTAAQANLAAEQARLDLVRAGARPEQIKTAEAQVAAAQAQAQAAAGQVGAAQAAVALVDDQIARLAITAPADGVILVRSVQPGEVVLPGGPLLTLGDLSHLTLTVYLPEDQYGVVRIGDRARVTADSFPGRSFTGTVQYIADQAEFTPRNVQTPEGRRTTVFAVKLAVENPDLQLKPGMPADVAFGG